MSNFNNSNNSTNPIAMQAMDPQEYAKYYTGQLQRELLHNPSQIAAELENNRQIQRDAAKTNNDLILEKGKTEMKKEVIKYREDLRQKRATIKKLSEKEGAIWFCELDNESKRTLREVLACNCCIVQVNKYERATGEKLFQLVLRSGNEKLESILYPEECLSTYRKLQKTALSLCIQDSNGMTCNDEKLIWKWLWRKVWDEYHKADVQKLPALPGWGKTSEKYQFWAGNRSSDLLMNEVIRGYTLRYTKDCSTATVKELFSKNSWDSDSKDTIGTLLVLRLVALLGSLCTEEPIPTAVILYGDNALSVAKKLLGVSDTANNIINLESDGSRVIQKKLCSLKEEIAIFTFRTLANKSTRNHLHEVLSWLDSGFVEAARITVPYIFCMKSLSVDVPVENSILINADTIQYEEWEDVFTVVQSWWVDQIEKGGLAVVEQLRENLKQQTAKESKRVLAISEGITQQMTYFMHLEKEDAIHAVLQAGTKRIKGQLNMQQIGYMQDLFHNTVLRLAQGKHLEFFECRNIDQLRPWYVFYDEEYYYFTNDALKWICYLEGLSEKAMLAIKKELTTLELTKIYKNSGSHNRELQVDVTIKSKDGSKKRIAAFAIKREFWDGHYGVCLYEMGEVK